MKIKLITSTIFILLVTSMLTIAFDVVPTFAQEDVPYEVLDEVGTHFELQHFNVSITTDTTVHIVLLVSSEMIGCFIENASMATSTQLTLGNLKPLTTYYMYQDSYINENVFTTDDVGSYTYTQDLSQLHHVFIQPRASTIYIDENTTLQCDIYDAVVITADNIVLDLNGYNIIGGGWWPWAGVNVYGRNNVTIKNGGISNFYFASIDASFSSNITISNITMTSNICVGIYLSDSVDNVISNNTIASNGWSGFEVSDTYSSVITGNNFTSNDIGLDLGWGSTDNIIYHNNFIDNSKNVEIWDGPWFNIWDDGYPSGGNYWSDYTGEDANNDGIGDTPYIIDEYNEDRYPFMNESGWLTPQLTPQQLIQDEILVIESWGLDGGVEKSLTAKLGDAMTLLDKGNTNGAIRKLQDLIKKVENDATHLTQEQRDYIIQTTQEIIDRIG